MVLLKLLAIDPGNHAGWAYWQDGSLLVCGVDQPPYGVAIDVLVIERPEIYQGTGKKASDESTGTLLMNAGRRVERVLSYLTNRPPTSVYGVYPKTWKKGASKEAHHKEMMPRLDLTSMAVVQSVKVQPSQRDDMLDAVFLGLWSSDRLRLGVLESSVDYKFKPLK